MRWLGALRRCPFQRAGSSTLARRSSEQESDSGSAAREPPSGGFRCCAPAGAGGNGRDSESPSWMARFRSLTRDDKCLSNMLARLCSLRWLLSFSAWIC